MSFAYNKPIRKDMINMLKRVEFKPEKKVSSKSSNPTAEAIHTQNIKLKVLYYRKNNDFAVNFEN